MSLVEPFQLCVRCESMFHRLLKCLPEMNRTQKDIAIAVEILP